MVFKSEIILSASIRVINRLTFVVVLFHIHSFCLRAQDISIQLSLNEGESQDVLAPYLEINYINEGDGDFFFPALLSRDWELPHFSKCFPIPDTEDVEYVKQSLFVKRVFHGECYQLLLDFIQEKNPYAWSLLPMNAEVEYEMPVINYFLHEYYRFLGDDKYAESFFKKSELRCPRRLRHNPSLVFLRAGESYTQIISIRGLKDTGIILSIGLSSDTPPNTMSLSMAPGDSYTLPHTLQGYTLYQGVVQSNCLLLDFSGKNEEK